MRAGGLVGCHRRRRTRTTVADPTRLPAPNLVAQDFAAPVPNRRWLGNSTDVPTGAGWWYLAVLLDAHARRVVGWAMADHLRTELALDALALALSTRHPPPGLIHHTARGSQYTAAAYQASRSSRTSRQSARRDHHATTVGSRISAVAPAAPAAPPQHVAH